MSIEERLGADLKDAMRARDADRVSCIRMLRAKLKDHAVALRAKDGLDHVLSDEEAVEVIAAYAKQRRDSIEAYRGAGREELARKEEAELEIIAAYLPEPLDESGLRALVEDAVKESGAAGPRDTGKVMKVLMPKVRGRADGKHVNEVVRAVLGGS